MEFDRIMQYLTALELHNERPWFHETHGQYEQARADFERLTELLKLEAAAAAPEMAQRMLLLPAKRFMYRIARDMRYAGDQPPYKTRFSASFSDEGREKTSLGFYVELKPGNRSTIGLGIWYTDDRALTRRVREYIRRNGARWIEILSDPEVRSWFCGQQLQRVPKGFSADDPMCEWIKYKQWLLDCPIPDARLTNFADFAAWAGGVFRKMEPMRLFLEDAKREVPEESAPETTDWPQAPAAELYDF